MDIQTRLDRVRSMRCGVRLHRMRAQDQLSLASQGMSRREATNWGGTGRCPLTEHALAYGRERDLGDALSRRADSLWGELAPALRRMGNLNARRAVTLYYGCAMNWEQVGDAMDKSAQEVRDLSRRAIRLLREVSE